MSAIPDEKGKLVISKNSFSFRMIFSHFLTPACPMISRT
jgi:hypothetical protein